MTIGVFDSGVGGLTVLRALHQLLPHVPTAYLGDTARVPYGTRSRETVVKYASNAARFLSEKENLSMLIVACNTASAVAIDALSSQLDIPVIGVIEPTARSAVELSKNGRIGVIGTSGTIQSGAYETAIRDLESDVKIFSKPCPLFVPLAEEGWIDQNDSIVQQVIERYLAELVDEDIDTLILGCTHYPLLASAIEAFLPNSVQLADAAVSVAQTVATHELVSALPQKVPAVRRYYVTDVPKGFVMVAERFLGSQIGEPTEVDL